MNAEGTRPSTTALMFSASECNPLSQSFEWLHAVLLESMTPDARRWIYQTKVSRPREWFNRCVRQTSVWSP
jgi:hypothetical protein